MDKSASRVSWNTRDALVLGIIFLFIAILGMITWRGPFLEDDYRKIVKGPRYARPPARGLQPRAGTASDPRAEPRASSAVKSKFPVAERGLWQRFLDLEGSSSDTLYYRPMNNLIVSLLARASGGIDRAGPFRAASTLSLGLAAAALYGLARRLAFSPSTGFLSALFFLLHPFNSWFYFQGAWAANPLSLVLMAFGWWIFETKCQSSRWHLWALLLLLTVYVSCLCKDPGAVLVLMLLPLAIAKGRKGMGRRLIFTAAGALGAGLYIGQRSWALSVNGEITLAPEKLLFAISQSGAAIIQYFFSMASGTLLHCCRMLKVGWGWPVTLALLFLMAVALWRLRPFPKAAALFWCSAVSLIETVIASAGKHHMIFPSRVTLFLALLPLLGAAMGQAFMKGSRSRLFIPLLALWMGWFGIQSMRHVWLSLDEERFYRYHNQSAYSWAALETWGLLSYHRGHWQEAERAFRQSLKLVSRASAQHNLGNALMQQGHYDQAAAHYEAALGLKPDMENAHYGLGYVLAKQDRLEEAAYHYRQTLNLEPDHADAHYALGLLGAGQDKTEEAVFHYKEALRLKPGWDAAHNNLGILLAKQEKLDEAIQHYAAALQIKPDYPIAHNNLGLALVKQGKFKEARPHFSEALRLDPQYEEAKRNLSLCRKNL